MGRNSHNGSFAIIREHVVGDIDINGLVSERVEGLDGEFVPIDLFLADFEGRLSNMAKLEVSWIEQINEFAERGIGVREMEGDWMVGRKADKRNSIDCFRVRGEDANAAQLWIGRREGKRKLCAGRLSDPFPLRCFHHRRPVGKLLYYALRSLLRRPILEGVSRSSW